MFLIFFNSSYSKKKKKKVRVFILCSLKTRVPDVCLGVKFFFGKAWTVLILIWDIMSPESPQNTSSFETKCRDPASLLLSVNVVLA